MVFAIIRLSVLGEYTMTAMTDFRGFRGEAIRLQPGEIGEAARMFGVETAVLLAFVEVEAARSGFDSLGRPKMLFEPHVFYRELGATAARDKAVAQGLAYRNWIAGKYPSDSYPRLAQAIEIIETPAVRSASYGLGQILGNNHLGTGHPTAQSMVLAAMTSEAEQLMQMVTLMSNWGMRAMLTGKDFTKADSWRQAAAKWNGSGYAKHDYHGRMARAYIKHSKGQPLMVAPANVLLMAGMKGEAVRNLQVDLYTLGYLFPSGIDGRYGAETERNVRLFQSARRIAADGKAGAATLRNLADALAKAKTDLTPPAPVWPEQEAGA